MKIKKDFTRLFLILGLILILFGGTYSFFTYSSTTNQIISSAGEIYLRLNKDNTDIVLTNLYPESYEEAILKNNNYIDFSVVGKNDYEAPVYYEIKLIYGSDVNNKVRISDKYLKFELLDITNSSNPITIVSDVSYDSISGRRIHVDTIEGETSSELTRTYRLRMWIDEELLISDTNPRASYKASTDGATGNNRNLQLFSDLYASVKVEVYGDLIEKDEPNTLKKLMKENSVSSAVSSEYVSSSTGIDFSKNTLPSNTQTGPSYNGNGVYLLESTKNDKNPVYFYRGFQALNNFVIFGGQCWKIIRTTETGGTKMIYNGPVQNGTCSTNYTTVNTGRYAQTTQSFTTDFENWPNSIGYYYSLKDIFKTINDLASNNTMIARNSNLGTSYTYKNGKYYVSGTTYVSGSATDSDIRTLIETNYYACAGNSNPCEELRVISGYRNNYLYYYTYRGGLTPEKVRKSAYTESNNEYPSAVATRVETWFENNILGYIDYLEDTAYCNDRRIESYTNDSSFGTGFTLKSQVRMQNKTFDLTCAKNDSFTVSKSNGNGALRYPVGLITYDELVLVGFVYSDSFHLSTHPFLAYTITMTPASTVPFSMVSLQGTSFNSYAVQDSGIGASPVISLKSTVEVLSGDGSNTNPYLINDGNN